MDYPLIGTQATAERKHLREELMAVAIAVAVVAGTWLLLAPGEKMRDAERSFALDALYADPRVISAIGRIQDYHLRYEPGGRRGARMHYRTIKDSIVAGRICFTATGTIGTAWVEIHYRWNRVTGERSIGDIHLQRLY
ncbi:MAG: hypothetical protein JNL39_11550 [Opitutaceae bacterium]|nr:hypothetical protein [Opitutaceae bacterium]